MASPILLVDDNQELLKLLVQLFEDAGHQVISAARGRQAIDVCRAQPPALAVLDVLLPDMTGYSLADALRKENPNLPLIFITGVFKAGRHALDARQKYSVLAYFEKPFDSKKLLEAVAKVVQPQKSESPEPDEDPFHVEMDVDYPEEGTPSDPLELTGRIKLTDLEKGATEIAGKDLTARPMTRAETGPIRPPAAEATELAAMPLRSYSLKVRRGELRNNLPSLITAFYISNETGELGVQRGRVKKVIYFERGQPVFALSNLISDRFGQFLVRVGKIKAHQLQEALQLGAATKRRTGDILIQKGLLEPTERMYYVGQQVKAIIYTLFGWEEGTYVLQLKDQASAEPIKLRHSDFPRHQEAVQARTPAAVVATARQADALRAAGVPAARDQTGGLGSASVVQNRRNAPGLGAADRSEALRTDSPFLPLLDGGADGPGASHVRAARPHTLSVGSMPGEAASIPLASSRCSSLPSTQRRSSAGCENL